MKLDQAGARRGDRRGKGKKDGGFKEGSVGHVAEGEQLGQQDRKKRGKTFTQFGIENTQQAVNKTGNTPGTHKEGKSKGNAPEGDEPCAVKWIGS